MAVVWSKEAERKMRKHQFEVLRRLLKGMAKVVMLSRDGHEMGHYYGPVVYDEPSLRVDVGSRSLLIHTSGFAARLMIRTMSNQDVMEGPPLDDVNTALHSGHIMQVN